jgi:hypothetical protein
MRKAFEKRHGKIEDRFDPGRYFLGVKLEEICNNDPQLEEMSVVTHRKKGEEEFLHAEVEHDGRIKVKKGGAVAVSPPDSPEELRIRYELISNAWIYASMRHPGRGWLKDTDRDVYRNFVNYILGPSVMGLADKAGRFPDFKGDVLHYERAIREKAYELVRDGDDEDRLFTLKQAIKKACKDPEVRQLNFVARISDRADRIGVKRPWDHDDYNGSWQVKGKFKGKDKGKGKGKDKGKKGKDKGPKKHTSTLKGEPICFKYNNGDDCDGSCGMVHCCQICFAGSSKGKAHPACKHDEFVRGKAR